VLEPLEGGVPLAPLGEDLGLLVEDAVALVGNQLR